MANIRKITRVENENTVHETSQDGPTAQDLINALNMVPDKNKPVDIFLEVAGPESPSLGLLVSTLGFNPETGNATMIVIPDTRPDPEQDVSRWGTPEDLAGDTNGGIWPTH